MQRFLVYDRLTTALPFGLILLLLMATGCLPDAQRDPLYARIAQLESENRLLREQGKRLEAERARLSNDLQKVSRELADLTEHADRLRQLNAALQEDARALRAAYENLREEHNKLLLKELELKGGPDHHKQVVGTAPTTGETRSETRDALPQPDMPDASITPCEAIIHFLQKNEAAIRQYKGYERLQKMRVIRAQFSHLMENAPEEAREAAEAWLKDLIRAQADPSDPAMNPFLPKRHRLLKACLKEQ